MDLNQTLKIHSETVKAAMDKFETFIQDKSNTDDQVLEEMAILPLSVVDRWITDSPVKRLMSMLYDHRPEVYVIMIKVSMAP